MSRHPLDRFALVVGLPLLLIGIYGTADDTGLVHDDAWLWIGLAIGLGVIGLAVAIAAEVRRIRQPRRPSAPAGSGGS